MPATQVYKLLLQKKNLDFENESHFRESKDKLSFVLEKAKEKIFSV